MKKILCLILKHKTIYAGLCPFTKAEYNLCTRCTKMIKINGSDVKDNV
jgi:hypothetical protein